MLTRQANLRKRHLLNCDFIALTRCFTKYAQLKWSQCSILYDNSSVYRIKASAEDKIFLSKPQYTRIFYVLMTTSRLQNPQELQIHKHVIVHLYLPVNNQVRNKPSLPNNTCSLLKFLTLRSSLKQRFHSPADKARKSSMLITHETLTFGMTVFSLAKMITQQNTFSQPNFSLFIIRYLKDSPATISSKT